MTVWHDVRSAARLIAGRPGFAAAAISTLALAIGVNVALFGLVNRVLLRPIDVPHVSELTVVHRVSQSTGDPVGESALTWQEAQAVRQVLGPVGPVAISSSSWNRAGQRVSVARGGSELTNSGRARFVNPDYFRLLGRDPTHGRYFEQGDDRPDALVVVLGHRFWRSRLDGDSEVVGQPLTVNGRPVTVIGIAARSVTGVDLTTEPPDVYLPLLTASRLATPTGYHVDEEGQILPMGDRSGRPSAISPVETLTVIARLPPGSEERVVVTMNALLAGARWALVPLAEAVLRFEPGTGLKQFLGLLGLAAGLTLLVGCTNLSALLMARTLERRSELSVRAALGASRRQLWQQAAIESAVLAAVGGVAALAVAFWVTRALSSFVLPGGISVGWLRGGTDIRTLSFALLTTLVAATVIGMAPAIRSGRARFRLDLRGSRSHRPAVGALRVLLGAQVTIAAVLLVGAVMFVRSVSNAWAIDLGFDPRGLVSVAVWSPASPATAGPDLQDGIERLVQRARAIPGSADATVGPLPLVRGRDLRLREVHVDGRPVTSSAGVDVVFAAPDYFATLGQPLVHGRDFTVDDRAGSPLVAIVNEAAAREFWPNGEVLGRRVGFPAAANITVVGIVRTGKLRGLRDVGHPAVYLVRQQHRPFVTGLAAGLGSSFLTVRVRSGTTGVGETLQRLAREVGLAAEVVTIDQGISALLMPERFGRVVLTALGGLALALTVVGIHGLVSCVVSHSEKEIGVRIALGAGVLDIVRTVAGQALLPMAGGLAMGSLLAWRAGRLADRFLYGLTGSDLGSVALAVSIATVSGLLATLLPVRRALRIAPADALRLS